MTRLRRSEARAIMQEELARVGCETVSSFQIEEGARPGTGELGWWSENTSVNERSDTRRSQGYLRAYLRIAGGLPLYAGGLLLDKHRLWLDRSVISRCERDGYLAFCPGRNPTFQVTDAGREWLEKDDPEL